MKRVISKCLLALAVLQGSIPADHCILKLAGMCCCDASANEKRDEPPCCHSSELDATRQHSSRIPLNDDHDKPCCVFTPANGLVADAQAISLIDSRVECIATAFNLDVHALVAQMCRHALAQHRIESPHPFDTPLYLRVQTFLI